MKEPLYIVYQCYGDKGIFYECAYSLLSLSRLYTREQLGSTEIWIYTDDPKWFDRFRECDLPLNFRPLNDTILKQWKGKHNFVHRVKIELLRNLCQSKAGNILYVDTDTIFTKRIEQLILDIEEGKLFMHLNEGVVNKEGNEVMKKLNAYLNTPVAPKTSGKPLGDMQMWNAGVLGFNTAYKNLLDDVLHFTDDVYPKFPKHIVEQFAFSVKFQQQRPVNAAAPYIFHYWNMKEGRQLFASFFAHFKKASWKELARYSPMIQVEKLVKEKEGFRNNRSFIDKLFGKKWLPKPHDWNKLTKQFG